MIAIKKKTMLHIGYAACILLMTMALLWRSSIGYCFAYEYDSQNGTTDKDGNIYLSLDIKIDNPFIVQTDEEILSDIESGYTGYVYFGYPTCPYCRNTVPVFSKKTESRKSFIAISKNTTINSGIRQNPTSLKRSTEQQPMTVCCMFCRSTRFPKQSKMRAVTAWIQE